MWWSHIAGLCCLLWFLSVPGRSGNLEDELYETARTSKYMSNLDKDSLEGFLGNPQEKYMLVLFHVGTCHICKDALPALADMAKDWQKRELPIIVGHVECTNDQEYWRKRLGFKGFPHLLLWHRPDTEFAEKLKPLRFAVDEGKSKQALGIDVIVTESKDLLLDASRKAKMGVEKDEKRLKGLGQSGSIDKVEFEDFTAQVHIESLGKGRTWYPLEALSYTDGSPVMAFNRPSFPVPYRPTSWKKEFIKDFAERMMKPAVAELKSLKQLTADMKDESLVAIVLCAKTMEESPGFAALAKSYQDKHRAYHASSPDACPVSDGPGPKLAVYAAPQHLWSAQGAAVPAVAVAGPEIAGSADEAALSTWFDTHRFPGVWKISYENFHQLIHAGRSTAMVALDETKKTEMKKIEKVIRDYAKPAASKTKGQADLWSYPGNSTYWGVVDGFLNGLDGFGVVHSELPRVVVFEGDHWIEDVEELTVWKLQEGFQNLPKQLRYGNGAMGFVMNKIYKPWKRADRMANAAGGTPLRGFLAFALVMGGLMILQKLGTGVQWVIGSMMMDENAAGSKPGKQGRANGEKKD